MCVSRTFSVFGLIFAVIIYHVLATKNRFENSSTEDKQGRANYPISLHKLPHSICMASERKHNVRLKTRANQRARADLWDTLLVALGLFLFTFSPRFFLLRFPDLTDRKI